MKNDRKIIRLTFATSFFHSLVASLMILLNINTLFAKNYENWLYVGKVAAFFVQEINRNHIITWVIIIAILCFIAYSIIYPIGQTAIIHYLNDKDKSIKKALKKWKEEFFPMFEYGIASLIISPTVYRLMVLKIIISWWLHNGFVILLLIIRFIAMTIINCLKVYTRYIIILEDKWVYDAIIKSYKISLIHFKETAKYLRIQTYLMIHFAINFLIIYTIPILLIYLAIIFNIIQYESVKRTVYGFFFWWILFGTYASTIVRVFFAHFWQQIYDNFNKNT